MKKILSRKKEHAVASTHAPFFQKQSTKTSSPTKRNSAPFFIQRKIKFKSPTYIETNPIDRILEGYKDAGKTTPTFDGKKLPDSKGKKLKPAEQKKLINEAGLLVFSALWPKGYGFDNGKKTCLPDAKETALSAEVIIPEASKNGKWQKYVDSKHLTKFPACQNKMSVPVSMVGKPDSKTILAKVKKNEQEHIDDLKSLCKKHLDPYFTWLKSAGKRVNSSKECVSVMKAPVEKKAYSVAVAFLTEWVKAVDQRDAGGGHDLKNSINVKGKRSCSRIAIESSV